MRFTLPLLIAALPSLCAAETFTLPEAGEVVGEVKAIAAAYEDTFSALARQYGQGYKDMRLANPDVDPWLPGTGTTIRIPSFYVLPDTPREGIVINTAEMRLYYYPPTESGEPRQVETYPVGIGRQAYPTPEFNSAIKARIPEPTWYPPESIIEERAEQGIELARTIPPGPDNPLGDYAIQIDVPGYFIHGTNRPSGIGLRVSHGCIRLYPEDIESIFNRVEIGTPVRAVHEPIKVGRSNGKVYLESHPPLAENGTEESVSWQVTAALRSLAQASQDTIIDIDWQAVDSAVKRQSGIPTVIGQIESPADSPTSP